jgi:hypothetical protein
MSMAGYLIMAVVSRTTHISAFSGVQLSRYPISIFLPIVPTHTWPPRLYLHLTCPLLMPESVVSPWIFSKTQ